MLDVKGLDVLMDYLPFLIPLAVVELGLMLAAVIHILRHDKFRVGNKLLWILISVCVSTIGPVLYFIFGRGENADD